MFPKIREQHLEVFLADDDIVRVRVDDVIVLFLDCLFEDVKKGVLPVLPRMDNIDFPIRRIDKRSVSRQKRTSDIKPSIGRIQHLATFGSRTELLILPDIIQINVRFWNRPPLLPPTLAIHPDVGEHMSRTVQLLVPELREVSKEDVPFFTHVKRNLGKPGNEIVFHVVRMVHILLELPGLLEESLGNRHTPNLDDIVRATSPENAGRRFRPNIKLEVSENPLLDHVVVILRNRLKGHATHWGAPQDLRQMVAQNRPLQNPVVINQNRGI